MCLKIYNLDPAKSFSAPGIAWQAALKNTELKLELLKIRGVIFYAIHWYAKANNKYMKYYNKNKESSYFKYWDVSNLYGWAISQKLPANNFEWFKDHSQLNEDFIKSNNEESDERYFLEIDVEYPETLHEHPHEELGLLIGDISRTIKNKQKGGFIGMLLGTLAATILVIIF